MTNKKHPLMQLSLNSVAQQVYLTLLNKGPCSISELAHLTGKYRPAIYKTLPELINSNLVVKTLKGKRVMYMAESPANLTALYKQQVEKLETAIPALLEIYRNRDKKPKISIFEGVSGIKTVFEDLLLSTQKRGKIYRYESPINYKRNKRYYPPLYWKRAGAMGDIDKYVITNNKTHETRHKNLNRFSKAVDIQFEDNISEIITDGKVLFVDYNTSTAILIENERFASFQKTIYKMLYEKI